MRFVSALSGQTEPSRAVDNVCEQCARSLAGSPDLACVFFSRHHVPHAAMIGALIRAKLKPRVLLGCSAAGVIADATELEDAAGLTVLAANLPGVNLATCWTDELLDSDEDRTAARMGEVLGADESLRGALMLADPFSVPLVRMLPALNKSRGDRPAPIFGGLASASTDPGGNAVILDDRVENRGGVLLSMRGPVRIDTIVSQGCRPFGPNLVITKARRNIIFQLGGRPAMEVISEAVNELPEDQREGLKSGLFIGRVINEYKSHFGRGDFLIRNVLGVDQNHGAVAVAEQVSVGQTIRLHMRDAHTAHEDLVLLLDAQKLYAKPAGVLLITCNGRGRKMFGAPNHDAATIMRAFMPQASGESAAKPGIRIEPITQPPVPLAGFFAAGEIGPLDGTSFVHGHTACAAVFRGA